MHVQPDSAWKTKALRLLALAICLYLALPSCATHEQSTLSLGAANTDSQSIRLFRIFKDKKFGFIDRSGKLLIEPALLQKSPT
jgi:hypothetical protein